MALRYIQLLLCLLMIVNFTACSSVSTKDEESIMALEDEEAGSSDDEMEEEVAEADVDEEGDEEASEEEESEEEEDIAEEEGDEELDEEIAEEDELEEEEEVAEEQPEELDEEIAEEEPEEEEELVADEQVQGEELIAEEEPEEPVQEAVEEPVEVAGELLRLNKIDYLANDNGGTVVIETSGQATYTSRANPETNQFVIEIKDSSLPESLKRPYILKEFGGEFAAINAYQNPGSNVSRIVLQLKSGGEPIVQQEGNSLIIIPPAAPGGEGQMVADGGEAAEPSDVGGPADEVSGDGEAWKQSYDQEAAEKYKVLGARTLDEFLLGDNRFFGSPISIETSDANIRDVISFIADKSGANIVVSDDVKGQLTLKLKEVPWDQALVIVMRAKNLGYIRQGSVLRISTLTKLKDETDAAARIIATQRDLIPLKVKVFPISYAKVEELVKKMKPFLTPKRGKVVEDGRTSTIIVTDREEVIDRLGGLIRELDIPPAQVMIEGKIIEASEEFKRQVGVNWSMTGTDISLSDSGGANGGPISIHPTIGIAPFSSKVVQAGIGTLGFRLGLLDGIGTLSANLSLAQSDNLIKIVSSPRIVTTNKQKAQISQIGEVVSKGSIVDDGKVTTTIKRTPVELKLEVVPQITAEGSVIMDVNMKRQFSGPVEDTESLARAVQTREAKTQVLVRNGQTAVIGGIFQSDNSTNETGIPGLKNIPVLGWLFKGKVIEKVKNELMIFLTPRILNAKDQRASQDN